jgi:hypothetical protein
VRHEHKVIDGDLVKVMSWYDNEWGYTNQMIREGLIRGPGALITGCPPARAPSAGTFPALSGTRCSAGSTR